MNKGILLFMLVFLVTSGSASFIRMTSNIYVEPIVTGSLTSINVSLINSGDEPAHDAQASLVLPDGFTTDSIYVGMMYPNVKYDEVFHVNISAGTRPGRYPVIVKLHYSDANAYPFSIVSPSFMMFSQATPIMVRGFMPEISLGTSEEKELKVRISNLDSKPHNMKVNMISSDELAVDSRGQEVNVAGNDEAELTFKIKSFGALPDSTYVVFATIEYDDNLHYSSIATGIVKVVNSSQTSFSLPSWLPIAVLAVLIGLFIYYQVKR